jgi:hypothetical protein
VVVEKMPDETKTKAGETSAHEEEEIMIMMMNRVMNVEESLEDGRKAGNMTMTIADVENRSAGTWTQTLPSILQVSMEITHRIQTRHIRPIICRLVLPLCILIQVIKPIQQDNPIHQDSIPKDNHILQDLYQDKYKVNITQIIHRHHL